MSCFQIVVVVVVVVVVVDVVLFNWVFRVFAGFSGFAGRHPPGRAEARARSDRRRKIPRIESKKIIFIARIHIHGF